MKTIYGEVDYVIQCMQAGYEIESIIKINEYPDGQYALKDKFIQYFVYLKRYKKNGICKNEKKIKIMGLSFRLDLYKKGSLFDIVQEYIKQNAIEGEKQ